MPESQPVAAGMLDARGVIVADAPCRKCSYNLRGLPQGGRCPECGTPVGVSLHGDLLRYSLPRWLRTISEGMSLILWGMLISIVVSIGSGMVLRQEPVMAGVLALLATVVGVIGTWKMTTPDPSGIGERDGLTARKLVRVAAISGLVAGAWQTLNSAGVQTGYAIVQGAVTLVFAVIGVAGEFAKLHYIGLLADRLPDDLLARRANFLKWAVAITYTLIASLAFVLLLAGPALARFAGAWTLGFVVVPLTVAMLVFAVMSVFLIYRMKVAVQHQIPLAQEIWGRSARRRAELAKQLSAHVDPNERRDDLE